MRRSQKEDVNAFFGQRFPGKRLQRISAVAIGVRIKDVRVEFVELGRAAVLAFTGKQHRLFRLWMTHQQTHQLETGIAGGSNYSGLNRGGHQARIPSSLAWSCRAFLLLPVM